MIDFNRAPSIHEELSPIVATSGKTGDASTPTDVRDPVLLRAAGKFKVGPAVSDKKNLFSCMADLLMHPVKIVYLIIGLIESNTTGVMFGDSQGGKTFNVIDMLCSIVTGTDWNGRTVKQGTVLYLAGEGHSGITRRVLAWANSKFLTVDALKNFFISNQTLMLHERNVGDIIREGQEIEQSTGVPLAIICIDTLAKHIEGDENNTRDMSDFVKYADEMRQAFAGVVVLIIHHTGLADKDRGRGNYALHAGVDFEIRCSKGLLIFTKMKDAATPDPIEFKLYPIQIGTDEDTGEPITSCIVRYGERSVQYRDSDNKLTRFQEILYPLTKEHAEITELRIAFYDKRRKDDPNVKQDTLKDSFTRSLEGLEKKGFIRITNGKVDRKRETGD